MGSINFNKLEVMAGGDCGSYYWFSYGDHDSHVIVECLEFLRFALFLNGIPASELLDVETRVMHLPL